MKNLFLLIAMLLSSKVMLNAQDIYLPVSSTSEAAKASYLQALVLAENAQMSGYAEQMNKALQLDPKLFMGYAHLSIFQIAFQQYEPAKALIAKALAIAPEGLNPAEQILRKLMVQWGQDPKSDPTKIMDELIAAYPKTPQAHELASLCAKWIKGDNQSFLVHTQNMLQLRPDYGGGYNSLGYCYMEMGQIDKAKEAFENYIRLSPKDANAYDSMGEYYMTVKDYVKSAEYYDKAVLLGMSDSKERAEKARSMIKN